MPTFNVYTGDGNDGTSFDHEIEAADLDAAVSVYMEGVPEENRDLFERWDEHDATILEVLEGRNGERAYNGGALFVAEIRPVANDPRHRPR